MYTTEKETTKLIVTCTPTMHLHINNVFQKQVPVYIVLYFDCCSSFMKHLPLEIFSSEGSNKYIVIIYD